MSSAQVTIAPPAEMAEPPGPDAVVGFFGKIPARGDFVRAGLPRAFTDPWDTWLQNAIAGSRAILGARWLPSWMEAPIWHFILPAGHCGPTPVLGLWLPSVDAAGRHFPLTLARLGALPANQAAWLAAAETIGLDAIQDDLTPDELMRRLAAPFRTHPDGEAANAEDPLATWWTTGSPFVPATRLSLPALPDAEIFAAMLCAVPQEAAETQSDIPPAAGGVRE